MVDAERGVREGAGGGGLQRRGGTSHGAAPGMPKVFATSEALGAELIYASIPVEVGAPLLDWRIKAVVSVSASTSTRGRGLVAHGWLHPGTMCACLAIFAFCNVSSFLLDQFCHLFSMKTNYNTEKTLFFLIFQKHNFLMF